MTKFKVEPCVSDYAVKDDKGQLITICNSKRNADLIAAILEKDSHCGDGWSNTPLGGAGYVFTAQDFWAVVGAYSTKTVYDVVETKTADGKSLCRNIVPGQIVRHFKGNLYEVKDIVKHTETGQQMVVYQALYLSEGETQRQTFTRPLDMFMEEVDRQKYPYAGQTYRMEVVQFKDVREGK